MQATRMPFMAHAVGFGSKTQCKESTTGVILVFVLTFTHVGYQTFNDIGS